MATCSAIGADAQGSTVLSETLAQYSALMVMEHEFGAANMRKFLEYELDGYLTGRSVERQREMPLELVENQPYIHYNKVSLVKLVNDTFGLGAAGQLIVEFGNVAVIPTGYTLLTNQPVHLALVRQDFEESAQPLGRDLQTLGERFHSRRRQAVNVARMASIR